MMRSLLVLTELSKAIRSIREDVLEVVLIRVLKAVLGVVLLLVLD